MKNTRSAQEQGWSILAQFEIIWVTVGAGSAVGKLFSTCRTNYSKVQKRSDFRTDKKFDKRKAGRGAAGSGETGISRPRFSGCVPAEYRRHSMPRDRAAHYFDSLRDLRRAPVEKLSRVGPMGAILDMPSGQYKTTIVDCVEGMEPTPAHLLPETVSSLLVPISVLVYIHTVY